MGATVLLQAYDTVALPGEETRQAVQILNNGPVVDRFELDIVGEAAAWVTVEPRQVSAFPYEMVEATLVFNPPRSYDLLAGLQPYALRVMSHEDVEGSVVDEATVTVGPYLDYSLRCAPATRRGRRSGRFNVVVGNRGNTPLPVQLFADDPESALRYRFRHDEADVPPGRGVVVPLRVRPRVRKWRGPDTSHPIECLAVTRDGERRSAELTWVQAPLIGPGVGQFAMAAFAAVTALAALWFLVFRPSVSSEANRQIGPVSEADDPGSEDSSTPSPSVTPTPSVSPGDDLAPDADSPPPEPTSGSAPPPTSSGDPEPSAPTDTTRYAKDFRLTTSVPVGGTFDSKAQYTVPKGKRLFLTDIFLENTANDSGIVRIQRDSTILSEFSLDTFRNLTRNLEQPLVFGPGQSVVLAVQCVRPGALPGQSAAATCTPAVSFSGRLVPESV